MMAAKKKTPTLAQVRKLAREKLGERATIDVGMDPFSPGIHYASVSHVTKHVAPAYELSRSAALRALYAALEAL